ncbi:MAG: MBL fold metallo-hydrolase [Gammaproteobacteria bacterium]|nr:MBL fold metallo-hydrolase [Gammaproteobacteria bacterium]
MKPYLLIVLIATGLLNSTAVLSACNNHHVVLQILGSGGPELNDKRASSSYLIWVDQHALLLIDAGGGSSLNYERSGAKLEDLRVVLFSHFHADHSADFAALVKGSYFSNRHQPIEVYGPAGNDWMPSTEQFMQQLFGEQGGYRYLNDLIDFKQGNQDNTLFKIHTVALKKENVQQFKIDPDITLSAIQVHHGPLPALAWRVDVHQCSLTFSGDMSNHFHTLEQLARQSDILVAHHAIPESATGVARRLHMPPSEIGKIADRAHIKKLVLSHRMNRTIGHEKSTETIIKQSYSGRILFADDLDKILP